MLDELFSLQDLLRLAPGAAGVLCAALVLRAGRARRRHRPPRPAPRRGRLLAKAPDVQTRAYLLCGWLGGLRLSEAYLLEWEENDQVPYVELARNRVVLPADFVKGKRDQWVPLDPVLREALLALPRRGKRVFHFTTPKGRPLCLKTMPGRIIRLAAKAGVRLTMHTLRKGFGCRYAGKVPAEVLQKLMRHANIKTTMDYYANVDAAVEEAVLGGRNSSRNKPDTAGAQSREAGGATPCEG
jgi:integrase